jgi:hypothetical protein
MNLFCSRRHRSSPRMHACRRIGITNDRTVRIRIGRNNWKWIAYYHFQFLKQSLCIFFAAVRSYETISAVPVDPGGSGTTPPAPAINRELCGTLSIDPDGSGTTPPAPATIKFVLLRPRSNTNKPIQNTILLTLAFIIQSPFQHCE